MSHDVAATWAIIPAAGVGSRMGAQRPKQYLSLQNQAVILHTLSRFARLPGLQAVYVGIAADDAFWPALRDAVSALPCPVIEYTGGASRAETVARGLERIADGAGPNDWVLVHDAVRPCVQLDDIKKLVEQVGEDADGGLLALPVSDTLKTEQGGRSQQTVDRRHLWRALTPQLFPVQRLAQAIEAAMRQGVEITDEASALEFVGARPLLVAGSADNIKITYPSDLVLAEQILRQQGL